MSYRCAPIPGIPSLYHVSGTAPSYLGFALELLGRSDSLTLGRGHAKRGTEPEIVQEVARNLELLGAFLVSSFEPWHSMTEIGAGLSHFQRWVFPRVFSGGRGLTGGPPNQIQTGVKPHANVNKTSPMAMVPCVSMCVHGFVLLWFSFCAAVAQLRFPLYNYNQHMITITRGVGAVGAGVPARAAEAEFDAGNFLA